jgi:replicative DNA helicase
MHNLEAEQAILCSVLINPACKSQVKRSLVPSDFYLEKHSTLATALFETDGDLIAIINELKERGVLQNVGGQDYVSSLMEVVSTSAAVQHHIDIVKECSQKRQLISLAQNLIDRADKSSSEELSNYMKQCLAGLDIRDRFGFRAGVEACNIFTPEKCLQEYSNYIQTLKENRFITGIHEIDRRIRGVAGGEVLVWLARAATFKTAILQNELKGYAQHSAWGAVFFSIEMPIASVTERYHQIVHGSAGRDIEEIYITSLGRGLLCEAHRDGI